MNHGFSWFLSIGALAACLSLERPVTAGEIVFEQLPNQAGGTASDTSFFFLSVPAWQQAAENVILAEDVVLTKVNWWGFYGMSGQPNDPPQGDEWIRLRFYQSNPETGLPDDSNIFHEELFLNPPRKETGEVVLVDALPKEYLFEGVLTEPIVLSANTLYWLEIAQVGDMNSLFRWEFGGVDAGSPDLGGYGFKNWQQPEWKDTGIGNTSLQLIAVPEPQSATLLLLVYLARSRSRGRRCGMH